MSFTPAQIIVHIVQRMEVYCRRFQKRTVTLPPVTTHLTCFMVKIIATNYAHSSLLKKIHNSYIKKKIPIQLRLTTCTF